ncbi:hypothetical protein ACLKA6_010088 [Drosophila palustris]
MEEYLKDATRAGISAQTSVGGVTATIGGHGEEQSSLRVASGHSSRAATPLQRQDGVVLEPLVTDTEFVFTGQSLTELELAQALARMPLNDEPQIMDSVDVTPVSDPPKEKRQSSPAELRRKQRNEYKAALKFRKGLEGRSSETLTAQETRLKKKYEYNVRRFERLANPSSTQVVAQSTSAKPVATGTASTQAAATSSRKETPSTSKTAVAPVPNSQATGTAAPTKPTKKEGPVGKRKEPSASKRQRSDDSGKASDSKRLRPEGILASLSSKPELQAVIIDRNDPEGKFTVENWLKLEEKINQALHDAMCRTVNPFLAEFNGIKWFKGAKAVACANEESLRFLKDTIHSIGELSPGAKIDVVPTDQVPERTIIKVWIPPPIMEDRTILDMIKRQNEDCVTEDWTIKRGLARDKGNGKELWISIGPESKSHLLRKQGQLKMGMGSLKVFIPGGKEDAKDVSSSDLTVGLCERRNGPNLYLVSAYLPYEEKDPPSDNVKALIQHAQKEGIDVILGCDANAHHTLWGSTDTNDRGESLLELALLTNLVVCNRGNHPTFRNKNRAECDQDGNFAKDSQESLQLLMNTHFPGCLAADDDSGTSTLTISGEPGAYADDLVLLITGKFLPTISELMENALGLTLRWAEKNGLGANPQKTEFVLFTRKTKIESFRLPTLGGTQLKLSKEAKYLGVILDSKLSWK